MIAFFGGRIELLQYGLHDAPLYVYDIASAYPHAQADLPSMAGGAWERWETRYVGGLPGPGEEWVKHIGEWNCMSMLEVYWNLPRDKECPIGPFPYRSENGAVFFPHEGHGIYCVEEVIAAQECCPHSILIKRAWQFTPASCTVQPPPFYWIRDYYSNRQQRVAAFKAGAPYDVTEKVLKLAMNAAYGKTAQRVGGRDGNPPVTANPYYAAVITARTRARLLRAAMLDPEAIVMMATDGLVSTRPLDLPLTTSKELGGWEGGTRDGGMFVQSGVYFFRDGLSPCVERGEVKGGGTWLAGKTRGIRPGGLGALDLRKEILKAWSHPSKKVIEYQYEQYITLGAAVRGPTWHAVTGYWLDGKRQLKLHGCGGKRMGRGAAPQHGLVPTQPARVRDSWSVCSAPRGVEWLDENIGASIMAQLESADVYDSKID